MVWIPSNIIGGGRWVEVDDNGEKVRGSDVHGKDIMDMRVSTHP
jgi:hypothetical protein